LAGGWGFEVLWKDYESGFWIMVNAASDDRAPMVETEVSGIDFRDRDLRGRDFSNESLQNADFSGADLRCCNFYNADLSGANFESAQIGFDPKMVHTILLNGSVAALGYLFVIGLLGELMAAFTRPIDVSNVDDGSRRDDELDKAPKYVDEWKLLGRSEITLLLMCAILCGLIVIFGTGLLIFGYVTPDSMDKAHKVILSFLAIAPIGLVLAIRQARDLTHTDFSEADLAGAQIDHATFQRAKTDGAQIDRVTWL
jgi:Pentapeptide repeats (8 copies)